MSSLPWWGYLLVLGSSLALSLMLVPIAMAMALRFGFLDHPGPAKSHAEAVPYLGGAAIVVSFAVVVLGAAALDPPPSGFPQLAAFIGLGTVLAIIGLLDDLRGGLSPWLRVALETAAGTAILAFGNSAHLAGVPGWVNAVLTVAWVVGVTNAFNLLDNMDGLSAGTVVIACLAIFGVAALQHRYLVSALALALAGCAAGFLRANFHPAKIYMGDAGSLFLGFVVAVLLLKLRANGPTRVDIAVILSVPGVALFDTALVTVSRVAHRRSPFQGGRDHTSHRLVKLGMSVPAAVLTIYLAGVLLGGSAMLMSQFPAARIVGIAGLLGAAGIAAVPLARVRVYDQSSAARTIPLTGEAPGPANPGTASPSITPQAP